MVNVIELIYEMRKEQSIIRRGVGRCERVSHRCETVGVVWRGHNNLLVRSRPKVAIWLQHSRFAIFWRSNA